METEEFVEREAEEESDDEEESSSSSGSSSSSDDSEEEEEGGELRSRKSEVLSVCFEGLDTRVGFRTRVKTVFYTCV